MKKTIISIALILFSGNSVWAHNYVLSYEAQQIENGNYPQLTVWRGSGLTINLSALKEESVKSIWLDDPSKLVVDYAGELCAVPCRGGVNVIHLKRVTGLNFDNLPSTARTTLTVVTVSPEGDKVYKFILGYGGGTPKYLAVNLTPPVPQRPLPPLFNRRSLPKPVPRVAQIDTERIDLLKKGLEVARQKLKATTRNNLLFNRFDLFISQLESGYEEEEARKRNSISPNAVQLVANFAEEQKLAEAEINKPGTVSSKQPEVKITSLPEKPQTLTKEKTEIQTVFVNQIDSEQKPVSSNEQDVKTSPVSKIEVEKEETVSTQKPEINQEPKFSSINTKELNSHQKANRITRGLLVAGNKKQINYGTTTYFQVQSAIKALRRGTSLTEAANVAKIKLSILEQLLIWGQPQPIISH